MQPSTKVLFMFICEKCGHLLKTTYRGYRGECLLCKGKMIPVFSQLSKKEATAKLNTGD